MKIKRTHIILLAVCLLVAVAVASEAHSVTKIREGMAGTCTKSNNAINAGSALADDFCSRHSTNANCTPGWCIWHPAADGGSGLGGRGNVTGGTASPSSTTNTTHMTSPNGVCIARPGADMVQAGVTDAACKPCGPPTNQTWWPCNTGLCGSTTPGVSCGSDSTPIGQRINKSTPNTKVISSDYSWWDANNCSTWPSNKVGCWKCPEMDSNGKCLQRPVSYRYGNITEAVCKKGKNTNWCNTPLTQYAGGGTNSSATGTGPGSLGGRQGQMYR
mgnify:CR=1 FL=1